MFNRRLNKIVFFVLVIWFVNPLVAKEYKIDLQKFVDISDPTLQMEYLSTIDDNLFEKVMPNIAAYYGSYRDLIFNNIDNPDIDKLFSSLSINGKTDQQLHILGILYAMKNQKEFFYGFDTSNENAYKEQLRLSVISSDEIKSRQLYKQGCDSNYLASCFSYFHSVNNFNMPCIINVESKGCDERMDLLAESDQLYLNAAIYNYGITPLSNVEGRRKIALMISQIYIGGITGAVTVKDFPDWISKHPFPRDSKKSKEWAEIANENVN